MINKAQFKKLPDTIKETFLAFLDDRGLKLSAALAYYTIFSLAPMLIVIISLSSLFYGTEVTVHQQLFREISKLVGNDAAIQIQNMLKNAHGSGKTNVAIAIGVVTLLIGATGVFVEIQDSINFIWRVKAQPKKGWLKLLINRMLSLSMVAGLGFLLVVSLIANVVIAALSNQLNHYLSDISTVLIYGVNILFTFGTLAVLLAIVYRVLPDVEIGWRDVWVGAIFTALLFMLGKYVIGLYIEYAKVAAVYGAAGSVIVILIWIYYSSAILYFGAEFTRVFVQHSGRKIKPSEQAVAVIQTIEIANVVDLTPIEVTDNTTDKKK